MCVCAISKHTLQMFVSVKQAEALVYKTVSISCPLLPSPFLRDRERSREIERERERKREIAVNKQSNKTIQLPLRCPKWACACNLGVVVPLLVPREMKLQRIIFLPCFLLISIIFNLCHVGVRGEKLVILTGWEDGWGGEGA